MNEIIHIDQIRSIISDRNIRIHYPMPLHNPFKSSERITVAEANLAYEAWLRNRLISGDKLIVAEMTRIIELLQDNTGKPVGLIGSQGEVDVIRKIINEVLSCQ